MQHLSFLICLELNKNTTNDDSNKQLVLDVIETVASILQLMNDTKAETKEREQIFDTYNQIEGCPVSSLRTLSSSLSKIFQVKKIIKFVTVFFI